MRRIVLKKYYFFEVGKSLILSFASNQRDWKDENRKNMEIDKINLCFWYGTYLVIKSDKWIKNIQSFYKKHSLNVNVKWKF